MYIVCCIFCTYDTIDEVLGFPRILLPRQPSGLEPGIVASAPQALTH